MPARFVLDLAFLRLLMSRACGLRARLWIVGISGKEREPERTRRIDWLSALETEGSVPMPKPMRLPSRLPAGSKYVIESQGRKKGCMLINRYVELPDGRRVELAPRLVPIWKMASSRSGRCRGAARR